VENRPYYTALLKNRTTGCQK